jgi:hypothetical protein
MNDHIKGCGNDDGPCTLYSIKEGADPKPLSANYWHIHCGYRPAPKIQNGILLCDICIIELGLRPFSNSERRTIESKG